MIDIQPLLSTNNEPSKPIIIAGPCSAETEQQVLETAHGLADAGVHIFRAGIWKPRTKPGSFEGVGIPGLAWLRRVREETGMSVATEVANRSHIEAAMDYDIDMLWIGARTTTNPFAMQEIAYTLQEYGRDIPVLVKNPVNPDLELWIGAFERLYNAGIHRLGAIHRGFTSYNPGIYRNSPYWRIPLELRRRYPSLPIICDPSHMSGKRDLISGISQQAMDMGYDGLIIESHCNPDKAWSDRDQQITPDTLKHIIDSLILRDAANIATESLDDMRRRIDDLDYKLIDILAKRMDVSREIGRYKKDHKLPIVHADRYSDIVSNRTALAEQLGLDANFVHRILSTIHEESVRVQITPQADKDTNI